MKLNHITYLCLLATILSFSQSENPKNFSENINLDLANVNSNLDSGIESFDMESFLYNAREAQKLITKVYNSLKQGQCNKAIDLVYEIKAEIEASLRTDEHVHGKMYLGKAKNLMNETFYEYEICVTNGSSDVALTELEQRKQQLKLQQLELEREELEIQKRLASQKQQEQIIRKKQFIGANVAAFEKTIEAYNNFLKACNCGTKMEEEIESTDNLTDKSLSQIKIHFLEKTKLITNDYMATLDNCDN